MWLKNYLFYRPTHPAAMYQASPNTAVLGFYFFSFYVPGNTICNLFCFFRSWVSFFHQVSHFSSLQSCVTRHIFCSASLSFFILPFSACQELCIDWKIARDKPFSITVSFSPEPAKQQFKGSQSWSISSTMGRLWNVLYLYRPTLCFFLHIIEVSSLISYWY